MQRSGLARSDRSWSRGIYPRRKGAFQARGRAYHRGMKKSGQPQRHFASDNYAGICPEALSTMLEANQGHEVSYGDDSWTDKASNLLRQVFETDCEVFFVFNGTSANSLSLASLCQSYHSILCHEMAHVEGSECGAPEFFANGTKVLLLPGANGKIDPKSIEKAVSKRTDIHYPKPRALSLTQGTEVGTVYSLDELKELAEVAQHFNLRIQMDGARFANAVVALGVTPKELTWASGVDVLCFGGTKNGLAVGEAVVFFDPTWRGNSIIAANKAGNWLPRCGFCPRPGWGCSRTAPGCGTPAIPTPWLNGWKRPFGQCPTSKSLTRLKLTRSSPAFPSRSLRRCTRAVGSFTLTWAAGRIRA